MHNYTIDWLHALKFYVPELDTKNVILEIFSSQWLWPRIEETKRTHQCKQQNTVYCDCGIILLAILKPVLIASLDYTIDAFSTSINDFVLRYSPTRCDDIFQWHTSNPRSKWHTLTNTTRRLCYRKDDRAMNLIYGCPESFWMRIENLKCVALAVPEIIAIGVLVGGSTDLIPRRTNSSASGTRPGAKFNVYDCIISDSVESACSVAHLYYMDNQPATREKALFLIVKVALPLLPQIRSHYLKKTSWNSIFSFFSSPLVDLHKDTKSDSYLIHDLLFPLPLQ